MRLIDADALKRKAQKAATEAWKMKVTARVETILNQFIDWIEDAPTIEERKTGKWNRYYRMHSGSTFVCNRCGSCFIVIQGENEMNFCPNCGSDNRW